MSAFEKTLIGKSPEYVSVLRAARIVAATDVTVLILGESGVGKELLAKAIHGESRRAGNPLITINCAALPETLAESELFGHRRGAFTGAVSDQPGRAQAADGGTLFLDEVGELPLPMQSKLLRFIETGEIQPVGELTNRKVDVRVISATNRDLYAEVKAGRFREDLYYRLHVVPLELPPLRERTEDLDVLLKELTLRLSKDHGLAPPSFAAETLRTLRRYPWPGNVRELRNLCERLVVLFSGQEIEPENLPPEFHTGHDRRSVVEELFGILEAGMGLEDLEVQLIRQALSKSRGNRSRAARLLGLSRDTLLYRMKKYAIAV
ncbi:MAG: sigma-54 interaction domain-containing protein [Candidatus Nitrospinota bacterium M3_3B_026]